VDLAILILADLEIFLKRFSEVDWNQNFSARRGPQKGADLKYSMEVSFEEAAFGTEKEVTVSSWKYVRLAAVPEQSPVISLLHAAV